MSIIEVSAFHAAEALNNQASSMLIDVRTAGEWQSSGVPLRSMQQLLLLSWRLLPAMQLNPEFEEELCSHIIDKSTHLFFICKAGSRSREAAEFARNLGFTNCYNVADGFEGATERSGWKNSNLPYQVFSQNA